MFLFGKKRKATIKKYIEANSPGKINEYEGVKGIFLRVEQKNSNLERVLMFQDSEEIMLVNFYSQWKPTNSDAKYLLIKKKTGDMFTEVKGNCFKSNDRRVLYREQEVPCPNSV